MTQRETLEERVHRALYGRSKYPTVITENDLEADCEGPMFDCPQCDARQTISAAAECPTCSAEYRIRIEFDEQTSQ